MGKRSALVKQSQQLQTVTWVLVVVSALLVGNLAWSAVLQATGGKAGPPGRNGNCTGQCGNSTNCNCSNALTTINNVSASEGGGFLLEAGNNTLITPVPGGLLIDCTAEPGPPGPNGTCTGHCVNGTDGRDGLNGTNCNCSNALTTINNVSAGVGGSFLLEAGNNTLITPIPGGLLINCSVEPGPQGPTGPTGPAGENGTCTAPCVNGTNGRDGLNGTNCNCNNSLVTINNVTAGPNGAFLLEAGNNTLITPIPGGLLINCSVEQGPQGPVGPTGPAGQNGTCTVPCVNGTNGRDGLNGTNCDCNNSLVTINNVTAGPNGAFLLEAGNNTLITPIPGGLLINCSIEPGPQGPTGPTGPAGQNGTCTVPCVNGTNGRDGLNGTNCDCNNSLVTINNVTAGPNGAFLFLAGNNTSITPIANGLMFNCSGPTGATGPQGPPGFNGTCGCNGTGIFTLNSFNPDGNANFQILGSQYITVTSSLGVIQLNSTVSQGPVGPAGPAGPAGVNGTCTAPCVNGTQGPKGDPGQNGTCTAPCVNGTQGPAGPPGANGTCTAPCVNGTQGPAGPPGTNGTNCNCNNAVTSISGVSASVNGTFTLAAGAYIYLNSTGIGELTIGALGDTNPASYSNLVARDDHGIIQGLGFASYAGGQFSPQYALSAYYYNDTTGFQRFAILNDGTLFWSPNDYSVIHPNFDVSLSRYSAGVLRVDGALVTGSATAPANTNNGDLTSARLSVGPQYTLNTNFTGTWAQLGGVVNAAGSGSPVVRTWQCGLNSTTQFNITSLSYTTYIGNYLAATWLGTQTTQPAVIMGTYTSAQLSGSASADTVVALMAVNQAVSNGPNATAGTLYNNVVAVQAQAYSVTTVQSTPQYQTTQTATPTIANAVGVQVLSPFYGGAIITTNVGVSVNAAVSTNVTNNYGLQVNTVQGAAQNNVGLVVYRGQGGTLRAAIMLDPDNTGEGSTDAQIMWGSGSETPKTNLYRSANATLKTDAALLVTRYASMGGNIPLNTNNGDLYTLRMMLGDTDTLLTQSTSGGTLQGLSTLPASASSIAAYNLTSLSTALSSNSSVLYSTVIQTQSTGDAALTRGGVTGALIQSALVGATSQSQMIGALIGNTVLGPNPSTSGLLTVAVTAAGTGYAVGNALTVTGGGGSGGVVVVTAVSGGNVTAVKVTQPGISYTVGTGRATTGGAGTGCTINILSVGNTSVATVIGARFTAYDASGTFATPTIGASSVTGVQITDCNYGSATQAPKPSVQFGMIISSQTGGTTLNRHFHIPVMTGAAQNDGIGINGGTGKTNNGVVIGAFTGVNATNTGLAIAGHTSANGANVGVDVGAMSAANSVNVGVRIAEPTLGGFNRALHLTGQSGSSSAGIYFGDGTDGANPVTLYRSATGVLRTDGAMTARSFVSISGTPGIAAGTGAGTGPTLSVIGTDCNQYIQLTTGTSPAASSPIFTLTFTTALVGSSSFPVFSPANAAAAQLSGTSAPYMGASNTATWQLWSGSTPLSAGVGYIWMARTC